MDYVQCPHCDFELDEVLRRRHILPRFTNPVSQDELQAALRQEGACTHGILPESFFQRNVPSNHHAWYVPRFVNRAPRIRTPSPIFFRRQEAPTTASKRPAARRSAIARASPFIPAIRKDEAWDANWDKAEERTDDASGDVDFVDTGQPTSDGKPPIDEAEPGQDKQDDTWYDYFFGSDEPEESRPESGEIQPTAPPRITIKPVKKKIPMSPLDLGPESTLAVGGTAGDKKTAKNLLGKPSPRSERRHDKSAKKSATASKKVVISDAGVDDFYALAPDLPPARKSMGISGTSKTAAVTMRKPAVSLVSPRTEVTKINKALDLLGPPKAEVAMKKSKSKSKKTAGKKAGPVKVASAQVLF
eukprot:GEMP01040729.1.p1 GENE.GEMP01040729.1~~GEMP01040729.1.p1  ORF type:complete len:359 (+),score=108.55 GEMP01040729.1:107-1183(+)